MHLLMGRIRSRWYCPTCARSIDDTDTLELRQLQSAHRPRRPIGRDDCPAGPTPPAGRH